VGRLGPSKTKYRRLHIGGIPRARIVLVIPTEDVLVVVRHKRLKQHVPVAKLAEEEEALERHVKVAELPSEDPVPLRQILKRQHVRVAPLVDQAVGKRIQLPQLRGQPGLERSLSISHRDK